MSFSLCVHDAVNNPEANVEGHMSDKQISHKTKKAWHLFNFSNFPIQHHLSYIISTTSERDRHKYLVERHGVNSLE